MRSLLFLLLICSFCSCRKECDTAIHQSAIDSATAVWFADSLTGTLQFQLENDTTVSPIYITGEREGWQYPEGGTDCKDLFLTSYRNKSFDHEGNKFIHTVEQNGINGSRVKVSFNGNILMFNLAKNSGFYQYAVSDTEAVVVNYTRYDSVMVNNFWYKPVYWVNAIVPAEPLGMNVQLYVTPHWGVVKYVSDTLTMELKR